MNHYDVQLQLTAINYSILHRITLIIKYSGKLCLCMLNAAYRKNYAKRLKIRLILSRFRYIPYRKVNAAAA